MATEPNTTITLYRGVPFDSEYKDTLYFADNASQASYFAGLYSLSFTEQSYQRINKNTLRIQASAESVADMNYLSITNINHGNRTYYGFITGMPTYINENTCEITYEIDVIQSYLFHYDAGRSLIEIEHSFVEREHSRTDDIGDNLIEENIELGEYVSTLLGQPMALDYPEITQPMLEAVDIVVALPYEWYPNGVPSDTPSDQEAGSNVRGHKIFRVFGGGFYNGLYSAMKFYSYSAANQLEMQELAELLKDIASAGLADSISAVFYAPTAFYNNYSADTRNSPITRRFRFADNHTSIDGYTPKNKKLFTYPYRMIYVDNTNGKGATYKYEYFTKGTGYVGPIFNMTCAYAVDSEVVIYPKNYKGVENNIQEKFTLSGYPLCPYSIDTYKNWLANNRYSIGASLMSAGLNFAGGAIGADLALNQAKKNITPTNPNTFGIQSAQLAAGVLAYNAVSNITKTVAQIKDKSVDPVQAKGSVAMSTMLADQKFDFFFYDKHIRAEYAEIIDNYFTMFGYACHKVKIPDLFAGRNTRPVFYYVKTQNSNVKGFANTEVINAISTILDNGITFWFNPAKFGNYSWDNAPVLT